MYTSQYKKRYKVDPERRIDSAAVVFAFLEELRYHENSPQRELRIKDEGEAFRVKELMNNPTSSNIFGALLNIQSYHQNWQTLDYVPSNLGKGFIFYFVCDGCGRRVKYLYKPEGSSPYRCRFCHGLSYPYKRRKPSGSLQERLIKLGRRNAKHIRGSTYRPYSSGNEESCASAYDLAVSRQEPERPKVQTRVRYTPPLISIPSDELKVQRIAREKLLKELEEHPGELPKL